MYQEEKLIERAQKNQEFTENVYSSLSYKEKQKLMRPYSGFT